MQPEPDGLPQFTQYNIESDTKEFLLVIGEYNARICGQGFRQPVVGLSEGWCPDFRFSSPFCMMKRAEFVISRVAPVVTGTVILPGVDEALSADLATNIAVMRSIANDPWLRKRCVVSNGGVFQVAQQRFNTKDIFARTEYLKNFSELPSASEIEQFCTPPPPSRLAAPPPGPPKPSFKNQAEFDAGSPEQQAEAIYSWQLWWQTQQTPAVHPTSRGGSKIIVIASPKDTEDAWKQPPTAEERESIRDESWKKY